MLVGIAWATDQSHVTIDPMLYKTMVWIIAAFGGALVWLFIRYVWLLIQNKNNPQEIKPCPWHEDVTGQIKSDRSAVKDLIEEFRVLRQRSVDKDDYKGQMLQINNSIETVHDRITSLERSVAKEIKELAVAIAGVSNTKWDGQTERRSTG